MMYSIYPRSKVYRHIPRLPLRTPDDYLRDNMVKTLAVQDVDFDIMLQLQTDPFRMPVENAAVRWPEKLSPFVPAARLHIPRQKFDSPAQLAFANNLSYNPWHCIPEHRPLGNQSRARRRMYYELSRFRQSMNGEALCNHAKASLRTGFGETTADGSVTLEAVYCLGNCALSPAMMVDGQLHGRVDANRFDAILAETLNEAAQ